MTPPTRHLEVESDRVYVVYEGKTGVIVLVHRVITHEGATRVSEEQGEARALEMATRFGHRGERLRVLRAERFDTGVAQRVNVKTLELVEVAVKPAASRRPARRAAGTSRKRVRRRAR